MNFIKSSFILIFILMSFISCNQKSTDSTDNNEQISEFIPQWAKTVVWYQIFPERFRDGDTSNNPTKDDIAGADPVELAQYWNIHPW